MERGAIWEMKSYGLHQRALLCRSLVAHARKRMKKMKVLRSIKVTCLHPGGLLFILIYFLLYCKLGKAY